MPDKIKKIDVFSKNIIIVFCGTFIANLFNLSYQLLIAHSFTPEDFAVFNSLLSVFVVISSPLATIQLAVAKYSAEFYAENQPEKTKLFISGLFKKAFFFAVCALVFFSVFSGRLIGLLKIPSFSCGYIFALLVATSFITPVSLGAIQGLEFFGWMAGVSILSGVLKLAFTALFIFLGYNISGAFGALLAAGLAGVIIFYIPLSRFISFKAKDGINYKKLFYYLFPVAVSNFCFTLLVSSDIILVKHFFLPKDAGFYSLAQMVGKIFLFLPGAISLVMFPKTSGLKAKQMDTLSTLKKSLFYGVGLSVFAMFVYNFFPAFILKVLTGKVFPEPVALGRFFSVSMSFFSLVYILMSYFLSIGDLRFLKYLVLFTFAQLLAIVFFHGNLFYVQWILCVNAVLLFLIQLALAYRKQKIQ